MIRFVIVAAAIVGHFMASMAPTRAAGALPPCVTRTSRARPVVAVVAENSFTELTDHVVPYGVLSDAGVAEVWALATQSGPVQKFPALRLQPQATVQAFDARYP